MWTPGILFALLAVASAQLAWKPNNEYRYLFKSRTATSIRDLDDQSAVAYVQADLIIQPKSSQHLLARLSKPQYASIQENAIDGEIREESRDKLQWNPLPLEQAFEMKLNNGVIDQVVVNKDVPVWAVNLLRSIISQLQIDTQGENIMKSKMNSHSLQNENDGAFKTMEDTIDGKCETLYNISPLPKNVVQRNPELVPQPQLVVDGEIMEIVKTKNFTNCEHRPVYNFGFPKGSEWEPADNKMESWFSRSNNHRIVVSGNLKSYTIQSSVTTSRINLSPRIVNDQKAEVYSQTNITLSSVKPISEEITAPQNPQVIKSLVYDYSSPLETDQEIRAKWDQRRQHSSESSASSSSSEEKNRSRRNTQENKHEDSSLDSSSSSSDSRSDSLSSEEWHQDHFDLSAAPNTPLLPYQIGLMGHSIQQQINVNQIAKKLSEQIGNEVQTPSEMPKAGTMERFAMLVDIIRTMSQKQIEKTASDLYQKTEKHSNGAPTQKYASWMTYRDAVAEAGTGPALLAITNWIRNHQMEGEEAAQVVSTLTDAAKAPTPAYMKAFFELVKDDKTQKSPRLFAAAAFSFTELLRMAQVDREVAHNRYPVHTYGPLSQKNEKNVVNDYIPYFAKELKKAVQQQDSPKIQVIVRALGNIAHSAIVPVFEPYLEGQVPMTTFQRTHLVVSMDKLARTYPRLARSVLYKIYANQGEDYQVRVAAVYNLMATNLPVSMLQRMAEAANRESNQQVRSAVQTAIQSQAELKGEFNAELRKNAQSVASLLPQEPMGVQYSQQNFTDYVSSGLDLAYEQSYRTIGSQDNLYPSTAFYKLRRQLNGQVQPSYKAGYMTSSVSDLADLLQQQLWNILPQQHKYKDAAEKITREIIEKLNVQANTHEKVEGSIRMDFAGSKRFYSFDNETIEELFKDAADLLLQLQSGSGYTFTYQKMFYDYEAAVAFPAVTGIPFVYTYKTPSMIAFNGKLHLTWNKDATSSLAVELQAVTTSRHQGRVSFVTPYDHKQHIAGVDENMHAMVPLKAEIQVNLKEQTLKVQLKPQEAPKQRLFHYSSWPYTAQHDILSMKPLAEEQTTQHIEIEERKWSNFEATLGGQSVGIAFRVKAKTQKPHVDFRALYEQIENHDMVSAIAFPTAFLGLEHTSIDLFFEPTLSSAKLVTLTAHYENSQQEKTGEENYSSNQALPTDQKPSSQARRTEFLRKVQSGIKESTGHVVDLAVEIEGKPAQMVATVAVAKSQIDEKSRVLAYYRQQLQQEKYEAAFDGAARFPFTPIRDVQQALNDASKAEIRVKINYGKDARNGAQVSINGDLQQSAEYQKYAQAELNEQVQGKRQTQHIKYAGIFDQQQYSIKYQNVGQYALNMTYQAYSVLRHLGYPYMSENLVDGDYQQQSQNAQVQLRFSPDLETLNVEINTPAGDAKFNNIRAHRLVRELLAVNPMLTPAQRLGNAVLHEQYDATCYFQDKEMNTFDDETYPIALEKFWHVLMVSQPQKQYQNGHQVEKKMRSPIAVLGRQNQGQEVRIIASDDTTIEVYPGQQRPVVKVNGQDIQVSAEKVWRQEQQQQQQQQRPQIEIYASPNGEVKVIVDDIELIHDNERVHLRASHRRMAQVQGLCGAHNGEYTDLFTPQQTTVQDFEQFAASWALNAEGKRAHHQQEALKNGQKKEHVFNNVVSEQDAARVNAEGKPKKNERYGSSGSSSSSSSESDEKARNQLHKESQTGCAVQRIQVIEKDGKHCFSILPQSACKSHCKVEATTERSTKFYCVDKTSTSEHWANMVARGANPDFRSKGNAVEMKYDAPIKCLH